jgi:hypothetical protein
MSRSHLREIALSRWDNEGGAVAPALPEADSSRVRETEALALGNSELVQLRIRVIAVESLLVTLLSDASAPQLDLARDMASYISPRRGYTQHRMTIHAATQIRHLVGRARQIRGRTLSCAGPAPAHASADPRTQPAPSIRRGSTQRSKSLPLTPPTPSAASRRLTPSRCACLAIAAARS